MYIDTPVRCRRPDGYEMRNMDSQTLGQRSKWSDDTVVSREQCDLTLMARAVSRVEVRRNRIDEVAGAIENATYRVPANLLAACLMLEMLQ
jgi:anti-sigma28 factor (negative regulator of flagellin synthesis)